MLLLWGAGKLINKAATSFTSAATAHGGQETTITALNNTFSHWGCVIVPPGYADPIQFQAGNPYGASHTSNNGDTPPGQGRAGLGLVPGPARGAGRPGAQDRPRGRLTHGDGFH